MAENFTFEKNIASIVIPADEIKDRVKAAGRDISKRYEGKPLLIIGLLKGSVVFISDLIRAVTIPCELDFMRVSSYVGDRAGELSILSDITADVSKFHVIIAEDIIDTGNTLKKVSALIKSRNPLSLRVITLIDKPARREVDFEADMSLFSIPDRFIVGYGLDYNEFGRNLPYIAEFKKLGVSQ